MHLLDWYEMQRRVESAAKKIIDKDFKRKTKQLKEAVGLYTFFIIFVFVILILNRMKNTEEIDKNI